MEIITIKANDLLSYLKKTTANGLVEDCKLCFTKEGLDMQHINKQRNILIKGNLAREVFEKYTTMEINIKNTDTLLKVLKTFGDSMINIASENNMIKIRELERELEESKRFHERIMEEKDKEIERLKAQLKTK